MTIHLRLKLVFTLILVAMIGVSVWASLHENVGIGFLHVSREPWGVATLFDAYGGFITFYVWVFYKERSAWARGIWLISILLFGNIAMSIYMLWQLGRLPKNAGWSTLLLRTEAGTVANV